MEYKSVEAQNTTNENSLKPFIVSGIDGNYTVVEISEQEFLQLAKRSIGCCDISSAASKVKVSSFYFRDADMTYGAERIVNLSDLVNPNYETFLVVAEDEKRARRLVRCYYLDHFNTTPHTFNGIEYKGLHYSQLE